MDGTSLVQDFAVILVVAAVAGWLMRLIGLSAVVGYLVAGVIVGPHTPPFALITDLGRIQTASQLGLVFLMFFVGLNLSLERIRRLGIPVVLATLVTAVVVYNLAQLFAWTVGWNDLQALLFAAALMASSSAIITKMLSENRLTHEIFARNALGLTVLEDVVAVVMLTLIGSRLGGDVGGGQALGQTLLLLLAFVVILIVGGLLLIPKVFEKIGKSSNADLKSILVTGLLCASGVAAVKAGFSIALGAFLFGVVVSETRFKVSIERRLAGAQDMFSAMFFVAIGMLIDVSGLFAHLPMILAVAAFALVARTVAATLGFLLTGAETKTAIATGLTATPVGEFSYIIAQIGVAAAVFEESFYLIAVAASIVTAVLAPLLARHATLIANRADALQPAAMRRFVSRYRDWLRLAGNRYRQNSVWRACRRRTGIVFVELFLLTGLLGFSLPVADAIERFLARAGYRIDGWEPIYWTLLSVVGAGLLTVIWRGLASLSGTVATAFAGEGPRAAPLRRLVRRSLIIIATAGLFLLVASLLPIPTTVPWIPLLVLGALLPLAIFFWRRVVDLHLRFQASLERAVEPELPGPSGLSSMRDNESPAEWGVELAEVVLPEHTIHAGASIAMTQLRPHFGCSIVGVERHGQVISNPRADFLLFPEDRLLLFGPPEQARKAISFLSEEGPARRAESDFDEAILETLDVPAGSPRASQTLGELRLFNVTGVQLMGIERAGQRTLSPSADEILYAGDRLLALGTQSELRDLRAWLAEAGWQPAAR